ncbi:GntP family permease [Leekyejoonella antrihumi]|uniref:Gluconate transporter n=1 Tax=Leekyejoonella antrihumi TaxID=1660198 RepID=A0A563E9L5_9MICO|nr:gluconate:H+ symporter [Leekyejoonella antrihumi]TWP38923.1 gluconate transporter [Leekyejoonella antrihumi]
MTAVHALGLLAASDKPLSSAGNGQLIAAALLGIATVVLLIVWARFHPFIGLIVGTAVLGAVAAVAPGDIVNSFVDGLGSTFGSVGLLIALGAMLGKLLADSGGANQIVDSIIDRVGPKTLPWAMALIAAIIGLPMFFEIGVVILVPIILLVARKTGVSLMKVGIPALAGLSILHGLVPPHPGPETAIALLHAPLSYTLVFGLIIAVPTLIIAGPLLAPLMDRLVPVHVGADGVARSGADPDTPPVTDGADADDAPDAATDAQRAAGATRRPSFFGAIISVVLPVLLMLVKAIGDLTLDDGTGGRSFVDFIGEPSVALLAGVLVAMLAVGRASGMPRAKIHQSLGSGLPPVASIMLIVAAGGGFKTVLSDSGVSEVIAHCAKDANMSVLLLGWLVAVAIRLATGSATVATVTAAGIVEPLGHTLSQPHLALLVLAVGSGSLFFSHVNDAGFWLVKEYFGLTVWQTIKSWSVMETVISVVALICVLIIGTIV